MEVVILILKAYIIFVMLFMSIYTIRHIWFTINRMSGEQRIFTQDIIDDELPYLTVLIPMHNEEQVATNILERMLVIDYPHERLEIIPINDHSSDKTKDIINDFATKDDRIKPLHRSSGKRGKPAAMNEAMQMATGEVILVFDADYLPPKGILRDMAVCFFDPEVGAVMGRVVPINVDKNMLTRLIDLQRIGGYQVDQQARHNLSLVPQYGGTVGGFRREMALELGGFNPDILTEDTELTYKLVLSGWKVVYANRAECYEEVPEDWNARARQVKRWAHGHTQVMWKYLWPIMRSRVIHGWEKVDAVLLLLIYAVPTILLLGLLDSVALFFLGEMNIVDSALVFIYVAAYNSYGNFAPFYQIAGAALLDGVSSRMLLIPYLLFNFFFNLWYISAGFLGGTLDSIFTKRQTEWEKTPRYRKA